MKTKILLTLAILISCVTMDAAVIGKKEKEKPANKDTKVEVATNEGKKWEFFSIVVKPSADELAEASNYKFGKETGYLYNMFLEAYVSREEVVPGDPTRRTIIRKPAIYNAVRAIEKQLAKDVKKNLVSKEQATNDLTKVLKVAISAIDSESETFEDALQENRKNTTHLISVFRNVTLTEF